MSTTLDKWIQFDELPENHAQREQYGGKSQSSRRFGSGISNQALLARMAFARASKGVASSGRPTVRNKDA